jgi:hypothetical protein
MWAVMRIRVVVPEDRREVVLHHLRAEPAVCDLTVWSSDGERPAGSIIECEKPACGR